MLAELEGRREYRRGLVLGSSKETWPSQGSPGGLSRAAQGEGRNPLGESTALQRRQPRGLWLCVQASCLPWMTAVGLPSAGTAALSPSRDPRPTVGRPRLTFEEAIAGGDAAIHCSPGGPPRNSKGSVRKEASWLLTSG